MGKMNPEWKRAVKFTLFSMSAAVVELSSYALCNHVFSLAPWICQLVSQILSVLWNFTFNRRFTFQSAGNVPLAMVKTALFYVFYTPFTTWLTRQWTEVWLLHEYLIKALTMVGNLVLEFLYQKYYVFRDTMDTNDIARKEKQ
ncbi:MAG: GtrA family protein [Oscillospiraceae bacterium]|nr:GtrA family protein [Oscillospiraceae bacterium]